METIHEIYQRNKAEERRLKMLEASKWLCPDLTPKPVVPLTKKQQRHKYKTLVWRLTRTQDLSSVPGIEKRAWKKFDLDHIISIWDGFNLGLPAAAIASISNLRIIPHQENTIKSGRSHFEANPLSGLLVPQPLHRKHKLH